MATQPAKKIVTLKDGAICTLRPGQISHAEVLAEIDKECYRDPWSEDEFCRHLAGSKMLFQVAYPEDSPVPGGYCVLERLANGWHFWAVAVHPVCQRNWMGTALVDWAKSVVSYKRPKLACSIDETSLDNQLFLASQGFRCIGSADPGKYDFVWEIWQPSSRKRSEQS